MKEGALKEWTQKMKERTQKIKECKIKSYLLSKKDTAYVILPPSTKMKEEPIVAPWDGETWLLVTTPSTMLRRSMSMSWILSLPFFNPLHQPTS